MAQLTIPIQVNFDDDKLQEIIRNALDENPDYTLVVRCKNCKHGDNHCDKQGLCTYCNVRGTHPVRMKQTDFCSWGEEDTNDDE